MGAGMIPANFHSLKSRSKTDMELLLAIKQGVLFSPMHEWGDRLSEQEMLDVLRSIHTLASFNPINKVREALEGRFITVTEKTCRLLRQRSFLLRPGMPQGRVSPLHEFP